MGEGEMEYGQTVILRTPKKTRERKEGRVTIRVYLRSIDLYEARGPVSAGEDGTSEQAEMCIAMTNPIAGLASGCFKLMGVTPLRLSGVDPLS